MFHLKNKNFQLFSAAVPAVFIVFSLIKNNPFLIIGAVISLFVLVGVLDITKKRQSLWVFVLTAILGLPPNIYYTIKLTPLIFDDKNKFFLAVYAMLLFFILFSVEEIVLLAISRIIWRRQYKPFPREFDE